MNRFYKAMDPETGLYDTLLVRTGDTFAPFMYYPDDLQDTTRKLTDYAEDTMDRFCASAWPSKTWKDPIEIALGVVEVTQ
jgi:hypothetical protein